MGLSKANELLLLGRKIDAKKACEYNLCSEVVHNCDMSGDPFRPSSLASRMCNEIDSKLLSLPKGPESMGYFVEAVKGRRRQFMEQVLRDELVKLDERFDNGDVQDAARQLRIGGSSSSDAGASQKRRAMKVAPHHRSKL